MLEAGFGREIDSRGRRGPRSPWTRSGGIATATRTTVFLVGAAFLGGAILGLAIGFGQVLGDRFLGGQEAHAGSGTADSNGRMIAVTGEYGNGTTVLWLVDTEERRISAYRSRDGKSIEWIGARHVEWDFKVEGYHDESALSAEKLRREWERHALKTPVEDPKKPEKAESTTTPKSGER
jgi:hypothetical protein